MNNFSENLKKIRKEQKLTLQKAADKCRMSLRQYQRYDGGESSPGLDALIKISDGLGVSIDFLARGEEWKGDSSRTDRDGG